MVSRFACLFSLRHVFPFIFVFDVKVSRSVARRRGEASSPLDTRLSHLFCRHFFVYLFRYRSEIGVMCLTGLQQWHDVICHCVAMRTMHRLALFRLPEGDSRQDKSVLLT